MLKFRIPLLRRIKFITSEKTSWRIKLVFKLLNNIKHGKLKLVTPDNRIYHFLGSDDTSSVEANLSINSWNALLSAFSKGDVGFGEAYMKGEW